MPPSLSRSGGGSRGGWGAIGDYSVRGEGDSATVEAVLSLSADDAPTDPAALLRALQVAQAALRGERTRASRASSSGGGDSIETERLKEELRIVREELEEVREERDELNDDLEQLQRKERGGPSSRKSMATGTAQDQREKIDKLEAEARDLRVKNKDLVREAGRKDEIINARSQLVEELRNTMNNEREEKRQLEEESRVMRSQLRDYREKLENTTDSVLAREERNRDTNKQLRAKAREIGNYIAENTRLQTDLKERDDALQELALQVEQLKVEKGEQASENEERVRLVTTLEREAAQAEATEAGLRRELEELQTEMDEEEEANEEAVRKYERQLAELQQVTNEKSRELDKAVADNKRLAAEVEAGSQSREQMALRAEVDTLRAQLEAKGDEVEAARRGEAAGQDRASSIQAAVRAAESAGAQKLAEVQKKHDKEVADGRAKLEDVTARLDASKKRYTTLSEKFAQNEDVIVELRARMDEYERGVHGLREEVQEKARFKALHDQRSEEVRKMTSERNRREAELAELAQECAWLREQCQIEKDDPRYMDLSKLKLKAQIELEQERAKVMAYEDELSTLEKERTMLLKKLRVKALERGERAAKEGVSIEKLTAMEELAADLNDDPDFEGEAVGVGRLKKGMGPSAPAQQQAILTQQAISASFANVTNVEELRRRGTALQAELAQKGAALQEAEAAKRKAEREKASLQQDLERSESKRRELLDAGLDAHTDLGGGDGGASVSAQLAALSAQNDSMRAALADAKRAMQDTVKAVAEEKAAAPRAPPPTTTVTTTTTAAPPPKRDAAVESAAMAALKAATEQLDDRLTALKEVQTAIKDTRLPPPTYPDYGAATGGQAQPAAQLPTDGRPAARVQPAQASDAAAARLFGAAPQAAPPHAPPQAPPPPAGVQTGVLDSREAQRARLQQVLDRQRAEAQQPPTPTAASATGAGAPPPTHLARGGRAVSVAGIERSDVGSEGAVILPEAFSEEGLSGEGGEGAERVDPYDLIAALNAQLIEAKAMLSGQQSQLVKAEREVKKYRGEMGDMHEQQVHQSASALP